MFKWISRIGIKVCRDHIHIGQFPNWRCISYKYPYITKRDNR